MKGHFRFHICAGYVESERLEAIEDYKMALCLMQGVDYYCIKLLGTLMYH